MPPKVIVIPDIHQRIDKADVILSRESPLDRVILLGDLFDDFDDTVQDASRTAVWLQTMLNAGAEVCFGNHETQYAFGLPELICAGFRPEKLFALRKILTESDWSRFVMHVWLDDWLITHAGVHPLYLSPESGASRSAIDALCAECLESLREGRMHPLVAAGRSRGGRHPAGGVTWLDWSELEPIPGLSQIVGHTPDYDVRWKRAPESVNLCLDTNSQHYVVLEAGEMSVRSA
jgi:hypothetical protein